MPNRNTLNDGEKYDHSSHSTTHSQQGDLKPPGAGTGTQPKPSPKVAKSKRRPQDLRSR
jgi:hypothetical protein